MKIENKTKKKQQEQELSTGAVTRTSEVSRSVTSGFVCDCKLHAEAATFQGGGMHEGSNHQQANCENPSPCQNAFHNRRDPLARKTGGPERGARTQCTRGATCARKGGWGKG